MDNTPQPPTEARAKLTICGCCKQPTTRHGLCHVCANPKPTEARAVLPTLEDILTEYRMAEISIATAIDHIQCHIDEARTTPTIRQVLEDILTSIESRIFDEFQRKDAEEIYDHIKQIIAKQIEKVE